MLLLKMKGKKAGELELCSHEDISYRFRRYRLKTANSCIFEKLHFSNWPPGGAWHLVLQQEDHGFFSGLDKTWTTTCGKISFFVYIYNRITVKDGGYTSDALWDACC